MTGSLVDRATSDLLIGPDWAMNMEICEVLNHDPGLAKDVARGLRKRVGNRNPKVQLLALTLLETMIKNCGDIVHMHIAERDIPHKMVKIVKKKPDFHVKEKILVLIDTWQEAFGGPEARHPQFYAAYQECLRAGAVFPQRRDRPAPIFTPGQIRPLTTNPQSMRSPNSQQEEPVDSDLPTLSLTEIQNARGIMDVLAEMLNVLDPGNKEGHRQEVIVELVGQCRTYKQRLVHLVNTTSDEDLLSQGLALNDDLQRVLAKHDAIAAGIAGHMEKPKTLQALVDIDDSSATAMDNSTRMNQRSSTSTGNEPPLQQLLLLEPPVSSNTATPSIQVDPLMDLLSGEDVNSRAAEDPLALVPVSEPLVSSAMEQNMLALSDMFPQNQAAPQPLLYPNGSISSSEMSQHEQAAYMQGAHMNHVGPAWDERNGQLPQGSNPHQLQPSPYTNGGLQNSGVPQYEQRSYIQGNQLDNVNPAWNGQVPPGLNLQQQAHYAGVDDEAGNLPPPPWEAQPTQSIQPIGLQSQDYQPAHPGFLQNTQQMGMYPQFYGQSSNPQFYGQGPAYMNDQISQRMYGLSMGDNSRYINTGSSYQMPTTSSSYIHQQVNKTPKPEDKLFGDLVSIAKSKQNKSSTGV